MDSKRKTIYAISIALAFGLIVTLIASANPDFSVEVADRYGYARADLNDGAIVEYIGDYNVSYGSSGSGVFDPFVRLQGNEKKTDFESGYNTDAKKPEFDTKSGVWTHAILLSEIPVVEFEGALFWEFWADINDSDSTPLISLDDFELYLTGDPELVGYLGEGVGFGAFADEIYDFDDFNNGEHILINDVNQGSGRGDLRYLVPVTDAAPEECNYGNPACTTFIVLYSEWGFVGDPYGFDGGFEEWKVKLYPKLQVTKDIFGEYDTPVSWEITKDSEGTYDLFAGESVDHDYIVSVDPIFGPPENTKVYGTITIIGDEEAAVDATITDKFDGEEAAITGCSVPENTDGTYTIAAGATVTCDYELALEAPDDGTNTARVTFEVAGVKLAFEGSADILADDFEETLTGDPEITVDDTNLEGEAWSASAAFASWSYTLEFTCSTDPGVYTDGFYTFDVDNTATILETEQSDSETVTINCYAPVVSKNAAGDYDERHEWEITKDFPGSYDLLAGGSATHGYEVTVTLTEIEENFSVTGKIFVTNPTGSPAAMTVALSDSLNDAAGTTGVISGCTDGTWDGSAVTVLPGDTAACDYEAIPTGRSASLNTVSASMGGWSDSATHGVAWTKHDTGNPEINVTDTNGEDWIATATTTWTYTRIFSCSTDPGAYIDGFYTYDVNNTATIVETELSDSETVTINCYAPVVSKNAAGDYDERHDWEITKDFPGSYDLLAGGSATHGYEVTVTLTEIEENFSVTGKIFVTNPAGSPAAMTVALSDSLNDAAGTTGVISGCTDGTWDGSAVTVLPGDTAACDYEAVPTGRSADMNTVAASMGGWSDSATHGVFWIKHDTGYPDINVTDTNGEAWEASATTSWTYTRIFSCSTDPGAYTDGFYTYDVDNTATIVETEQSDSETVTINCYAPVVSKNAAGDYDERHEWEITKDFPGSFDLLAGGSASHGYEVTVTLTEIEENFSVTGKIFVTNPTGSPAAMTVALADYLNDAAGTTGVISGCTDGTWDGSAVTVLPDDTATCDYEAIPTGRSASLNTVSASMGGWSDSATHGVAWTKHNTGNPEINVTDTNGEDWIATETTTWTYTRIFSCSTDPEAYTDGFYTYDVDNTATIVETGQSDSETVTINCYAPVVTKDASTYFTRTFEWMITKGYDATYDLYAGESIDHLYEVTVDKIGFTDNFWGVEGYIFIHNPHPSATMTLSGVSDLAGGIPATVDCATLDIGPGSTLTCSYDTGEQDSEDLNPFSATNVATAVFAGSNWSGQAAIVFGEPTTKVLDEVTVEDTNVEFGGPYFPVTGFTMWPYYKTFTCPVDISLYINGVYQIVWPNTATIVETGQSDDALVTVNCTLVIEYETAYAFGGDLATCFRDLGESRWGWVNGPILPGEYTWPVYAGAGGCDFNDGTYVGDVTVIYDGVNVFVEWALVEPNVLDAEHIYAGYTQIPPEGFAPGQLMIHSPFDGSAIYIIVHSVVGIPQIP